MAKQTLDYDRLFDGAEHRIPAESKDEAASIRSKLFAMAKTRGVDVRTTHFFGELIIRTYKHYQESEQTIDANEKSANV